MGYIKHKGFRNSALGSLGVGREMGGFILASNLSLGIVRKWEGSQVISILTCSVRAPEMLPNSLCRASGGKPRSQAKFICLNILLMSRPSISGEPSLLSLAHHDEDWLVQSIPPNTHQFS